MSPKFFDSQVVVIGAGAVGLAVSRSLAHRGFTNVLVLEQLSTFGQGTSSRNSGVLHAGLYYPYHSWKRVLCVQGHRKMLNFCRKHQVNHEVCGKLVVDDVNTTGTNTADGDDVLSNIFKTGTRNGAVLEIIEDSQTLRCLEPNLNPSISRAIYSPLTGIVDAHELMMTLQFLAEDSGNVQICWECGI